MVLFGKFIELNKKNSYLNNRKKKGKMGKSILFHKSLSGGTKKAEKCHNLLYSSIRLSIFLNINAVFIFNSRGLH